MHRALPLTALLATAAGVGGWLMTGAGPSVAAAGPPSAPGSASPSASLSSPASPAAPSAPLRLASPPEVIGESSGLAASREKPGWFWTCNDSGGGERLVRYDPTQTGGGNGAGQSFVLGGVRNRDWEDLASFELDGRAFLLIADTGDNQRRRSDVALHFVEEPAADADPAVPLEVLLTVPIAYADGSRDCEAVAVDVTRGRILLGSKEIDQHGKTHGTSGLYELPLPALPERPAGRDPLERLPRLANLPTLMPTGMDVSADGSMLAICTYGDAMLFRCGPLGTWADVVEGSPERLRTPPRRQGEAVAFDLAGERLLFTSEGANQPTWSVSVPPAPESPTPPAASR